MNNLDQFIITCESNIITTEGFEDWQNRMVKKIQIKRESKLNNANHEPSAKPEISKEDKMDLLKRIKSDIKVRVNFYKTNSTEKDKNANILKNLKSKDKSLDIKYTLKFEDCGDYLEIVDGSQDVRIALDHITYELTEYIRNKYKIEYNNKWFYIDNGDGDEGCLYLE